MRHSMPLACAIAWALTPSIFAASESFAQSDTRLELPSQPLASALRALGNRTKTNILFDPAAVRDLAAPAVLDAADFEDALTKLLVGSGLTFRFIDPRTVTLIPTTKTDVSAPAEEGNRAPDSSTVGEIVVTGSRLRRVDAEGPQPVRAISNEQIQRSGQSSLSDLLNSLTEVGMNSHENTNMSTLGNTTISLRGLPAGTTLVLLNGRRLPASPFQSSTGGFFDISMIPLTAIERVEVLPQSASSIYGGDALAGVVNILLKHDFDGQSVSAKYGHASGTDDAQFSMALGTTTDRFSVSAIASYYKRGELQRMERPILGTTDFRPYGGADTRQTTSHPGNVYSTNGANLPGLSSSFAAIPAGSTGIGLQPGDFAATDGTQNKESVLAWNSVLVPAERFGLFSAASYDVNGSLELFGEMFASLSHADGLFSPRTVRGARVSAANPYNPFGVDVLVDYMFRGAGRVTQPVESTVYRPVLGAKGHLPAGWDWELAAQKTWAVDRVSSTRRLNTAAFNAALASSDPSTAFNPFQDGPGGSPELIATFLTDLDYPPTRSSLLNVTGFMRGPLELGSRQLDLVVGMEYAIDELSYTGFTTTRQLDEARNIASVFVEGRLPLIMRDQRELLTVSAAGRSDEYQHIGRENTGRAGLEFRPLPSLLLRGDYSTAYKPPSLYNLYAPTTELMQTSTTLLDPRRNLPIGTFTTLFGGDPSLQSQTSESTSLGVVWAPADSGLNAAATWWSTVMDNGIAALGAQTILTHEDLFPGRVLRAEPTPADISAGLPGRVLAIDASTVNFGRFDAEGIDMDLSWRITTRIGALTPSLSASRLLKLTGAITPDTPPIDRIAQAVSDGSFSPRWKVNTALTLEAGDLTLGIVTRYSGEYGDYSTPSRKLGGDIYVDASARIDVSRWLDYYGARTTLSFGGVNLTNRLPEYSNFNSGNFGWDPRQSDPRGRYFFVGLDVSR